MNKITIHTLRTFLQYSLLALLFVSAVACDDEEPESCGGAGTAFFDGSASINGDEGASLSATMFVNENFTADLTRNFIDLAIFTSDCSELYTLAIMIDLPTGDALPGTYQFNGNQTGSAFGDFSLQTFPDEVFSRSNIATGSIEVIKNGNDYTVDLTATSGNQEEVSMRVELEDN